MSARSIAAALAVSMTVVSAAAAQEPKSTKRTVDVLALDSDGRPATGLTAADFELRAGGRAQRVDQLRYVAPSDTPRTVVFVVDDLGLSFRSAGFVRDALTRFVDEQLLPHDRVAIVRTWSTYSEKDTTQTTTSDKKALHERAAGLLYNNMNRGARTSFYDVRYDAMVQASLECLQAVVRDVSAAPGRKQVVLFTDGIDANLGRWGFIDPVVRDRLDEITAAANRGGVVIYTVDAGGVDSSFSRSTWRRQSEHLPLRTLADETGGTFIWHTDIERALSRILQGEAGYYVLEYGSDAPAAKPQSIQVKVRKPGIKVRTRRDVFARDSGPA